ncbi:MAG: MFS transporter, partial [Planctomycetes bacterium]|nr:MFS transporter [Planctomycetota bacterium]
ARLLAASAGEPGLGALLRAWKQGIAILKADRPFRTFEIGFMLYGFAFLMSWPLLILFAEERLGLSYDEWTWAQGFSFPLAQIGGMVLFGRLLDRIGVERTTMVSFALLFGFLVLVPRVGGPLELALCYLLFGAAMAGVNLSWSLGPLHFATEGRAHAYTAAHLSCVGVRSLLAPFLGMTIKHFFTYEVAFGVAACLMALGVWTMHRLSRQRLSSTLSP